jgi:hypothetical protein
MISQKMKNNLQDSFSLIKSIAFGDSVEDGDSLEKVNIDGKPINNYKTPTTAA